MLINIPEQWKRMMNSMKVLELRGPKPGWLLYYIFRIYHLNSLERHSLFLDLSRARLGKIDDVNLKNADIAKAKCAKIRPKAKCARTRLSTLLARNLS